MPEKPVAIITGASRGIGAAAAHEFGLRGYCLALVDKDQAALNLVVDQLETNRVAVLPIHGNLEDLAFIESIAESVAKAWGRIDVLVNNAAWRELGTMRTIDLETWEKTIRVGLTAPAFLARWTASFMEPRHQGVIVNVSSMMSQQAAGTSPAYVACKGALDALTYELAALYGPSRIRVVSVNPGAVDAGMSQDLGIAELQSEQAVRSYSEDMIMLRRWASPHEIAKTIAWLASDEASYLTGVTVNVDGGWHRQHLPYSLKQCQFSDQFP